MEGQTQTVIKIDTPLWLNFKAECIRRAVAPTTIITQHIARQVEAWTQKEEPGCPWDERHVK